MKTFLLALGSVALFVIANRLAQHFGETRRLGILLVCGITATIAFALFGQVSAAKGLAATSAVIDILIVIGSVAWAVLLRAEKLTMVQTIGIVLGIMATLMIMLGEAGSEKPLPNG